MKCNVLVLVVKHNEGLHTSLIHHLGVDNQCRQQFCRLVLAVVVADDVMAAGSLEPASALAKDPSWLAVHLVEQSALEDNSRNSGSGVRVRRSRRIGRECHHEADARLSRDVGKLILIGKLHQRKRPAIRKIMSQLFRSCIWSGSIPWMQRIPSVVFGGIGYDSALLHFDECLFKFTIKSELAYPSPSFACQ